MSSLEDTSFRGRRESEGFAGRGLQASYSRLEKKNVRETLQAQSVWRITPFRER